MTDKNDTAACLCLHAIKQQYGQPVAHDPRCVQYAPSTGQSEEIEIPEFDAHEVVPLGDGSGWEGHEVCFSCGEPIDLKLTTTYYGEPGRYGHKGPCKLTNGAFRLSLRIESLRQQLAAVQAEREQLWRETMGARAVLATLDELYPDSVYADLGKLRLLITERDQLRAQVEAMRGVVEAFKDYDTLLRAWSKRLDDGNQHIGDDPELDAAYATILAALDALDAASHGAESPGIAMTTTA